LRQRLVVALAEAVVAVEQQQLHGREVAGQQLDGVVGRSVVGHDDARAVGMGEHAGQEAGQKARSVPV
jgi:hypothetical protein